MEKRVKKTIIDNKLININNNEHIVLGLSGGPDSVCLFFVLLQLSERLGMTLHPVHINHKIRPVAAEEDQNYVEKLCEEHRLKCSTFEYYCNDIAKEEGISTEEAGRNARYEAFYKVATQIMKENEIGPERIKIAVAQNLNDQAENLLMRIMRGTGTEGLAGIEYEREGLGGIKIIRPLLDADRKDIEKYCEEKMLNPRFDHTNREAIYTRNKIRLELIPYIEKNFNPNITEALNRLSAIAKEDKNYIDSVVGELMKQKLGLEEFQKQHPAIRKRLVIRSLEGIGMDQGITTAHVDAADRLISEGKTGTSINLPKGYKIAVNYDEVIFTNQEPEEKESLFESGKLTEKLLMQADGTEIRTRRPGDYIFLPGVGGRKKIQDLFVDMKVRRDARNQVPLLCRGSEVMWIIGDDISGFETGIKVGRNSKNYHVDEETRRRVFVELNKKI